MRALHKMMVFAVLATLGTVPQALAVQRTFVASYGLDTNPCSISAPCRGFTAALAQTSAGGEIIVLDSAGYGTVSIDKSVSIIAEGVYAGVTVFSGTGISISGPNVRVTLRGLSLNGQGGVVGIRFAAGSELLIDRCTVSGMGGAGIHVEGDGEVTVTRSASLRNGGDGVLVSAPGAKVVLHEVRVEENAGNGVFVNGANAQVSADGLVSTRNGLTGIGVLPLVTGGVARVSVVNSQFVDNATHGALSDPDAAEAVVMDVARSVLARNGGLGFGSGGSLGVSSLSISDSLVVGHTNGIVASGSSTLVQAVRNVVRENSTGLSLSGNGRLVATGNLVTRNSLGVSLGAGSTFLTRQDNTVTENGTNSSGAGTITPIGGF